MIVYQALKGNDSAKLIKSWTGTDKIKNILFSNRCPEKSSTSSSSNNVVGSSGAQSYKHVPRGVKSYASKTG